MKIEKIATIRQCPIINCSVGEIFLIKGKNFRLKENEGKKTIQWTLADLLKNVRRCIET